MKFNLISNAPGKLGRIQQARGVMTPTNQPKLGADSDAVDLEKRGLISKFAVATSIVMFGTVGGTRTAVADTDPQLDDYPRLRAYDGSAKTVRIIASGIAGVFERDPADTATPDNGGTIIVDALGRRWKRSFNGQAHLSWFGAISGSDIQTREVKAWLELGGQLYADKGTFITRPMKPLNFSEITFHPQCEFVAAPGFAKNDVLLDLSNSVGIKIRGNGAKVRMRKSEYTTGEWRHAVNLYSAVGVSIYDLKALDSGGDGFYVGGASGAPSRDIILSNCTGDNNRRQGLSVVNVINLQVIGGEYKNTLGAAPACGIDVESNPLPGFYLENVNITNVKTFNNDGGGILVSPLAEGNPVSVTIKGCTSEYDGGYRGAFSAAGVIATTKIQGFVIFEDCVALRPQVSGIFVNRWTEFAPTVTFRRIKLIDVASNPAKATIQQRQSGILVRVEPGERHGTSYGYANFEDIEVIDTRSQAKTFDPVFLNNAQGGGKPLAGLRFKNIRYNGAPWISSAMRPFRE